METERLVDPRTLSQACQRLASCVAALTERPQRIESERVQEIDDLVKRALAILEGTAQTTGIAPGPGKRSLSRLLSRMLNGGESTEVESSTKARAENKPPSDKHTLALQGHGSAVQVPDLIGFLSTQQKSGILDIVASGEMFALEFEAGDIVHAQSNRTPDGQRLGDLLVSSGAIGREALEAARKNAASGRLGEELLKLGLVSREKFLAALQQQIQCLFNRMFEAPATRFTFWSGPPIHADQAVRMNSTALLLEGARASDEAKIAAAPPPTSPADRAG